MCLLCVAEPGQTPSREHLLNAASSNPHGFGYAFHLGSTILTGRGMDAEEVVDRFMRLRSIHTDVWAMFHARFTTHGETSKANCHPFRVGGSDKVVLAHNGILPLEPAPGDKRSDTRLFADDFLPALGIEALDDEDTFDQLERWMGGSKVVVFSADERTEYGVYFLNQHLGHWKDGIWWSNNSYETSWYDNYRTKKGVTCSYDYHTQTETVYPSEMYEIEGQLECPVCLNVLSDREAEANSCLHCSSCLDCFSDIADCMCYHGSVFRSEREVTIGSRYFGDSWE